MFELLVLVLFCWIFFGSIRLMFKIAWGLSKILAVILLILALPSLVGCLLFASGAILLVPIALVFIAWSLLKTC